MSLGQQSLSATTREACSLQWRSSTAKNIERNQEGSRWEGGRQAGIFHLRNFHSRLKTQDLTEGDKKAGVLSHVQLFVIPWTVAHKFLCPWDSPSKSTGVCCQVLLQGIIPTQELKLGLPHCWRRNWQPTPVFLPGAGTEEPGGLQSHGVAKSQTEWLTTAHCHMAADSLLCEPPEKPQENTGVCCHSLL